MRVFDFDKAIVRLPCEQVVNGLRAGDHDGPSFEGIAAEHAAYVAALKEAGLEVTILPALPSFPDSIFVEDAALVFPEGAIILRPGAPTREAEVFELAPVLRQKFDRVLSIASGSVDGGDVLVTPDKVYIGLSDRTDEAGASALVAQLATLGREGVIAYTPSGTLHLKSASSLVDEEVILATSALATSGTFHPMRVIVVPEGEEGGANVLRLNDVILAGDRYPCTLDLLAGQDLEIVPLPVNEISKIDAGLTCMSLRWSSAL